MTTITEKVTECLDYLNLFEDPDEFGQVVGLVRDELLGFSKAVPVKKIAKRFQIEPEEV